MSVNEQPNRNSPKKNFIKTKTFQVSQRKGDIISNRKGINKTMKENDENQPSVILEDIDENNRENLDSKDALTIHRRKKVADDNMDKESDRDLISLEDKKKKNLLISPLDKEGDGVVELNGCILLREQEETKKDPKPNEDENIIDTSYSPKVTEENKEKISAEYICPQEKRLRKQIQRLNFLKGMQRVTEEFKWLHENPIPNIGVTIGLFDNRDPMNWRITLVGPAGTYYENGLFFLKASFEDSYPFNPPLIQFLTPIYHINVKNTRSTDPKFPLGHICMNILTNWATNFSDYLDNKEKNKAENKRKSFGKIPVTMRDVITELYALFYFGNRFNPHGSERFNEIEKKKTVYEKKARRFTKKHASEKQKIPTKEGLEYWDFSYYS